MTGKGPWSIMICFSGGPECVLTHSTPATGWLTMQQLVSYVNNLDMNEEHPSSNKGNQVYYHSSLVSL